ncbi:TaqI-like C-terminal specificity domain-containing protein [Mucilaginibacter sp. 10I4]|uniref:DUF7149 domain-containing protein n=1 Tax=Mucilaginibacter sp. 10I4 TaxID=3048580 RepID=UPI002B222703|nr:TaqI-like C-terminal specificity domain-containing protein [Mucilaginibacter sp. 10I4]MEB0260505.1 TaqI-like C-terminal specificity domain-containing protein [Mucilaginibacter sp. 10I4]
MKLIPQPKLNKALDKALLKHRPFISEIELFKTELIKVLDHTDQSETEEFHKNLVSNFLTKAFYADTHFINTKGRQDLVIHTGKDNKHSVGVIIEAKRPTNKADWFTPDKPNSKALQELVLYYLRERIEAKNIDIKYLIATNINEWYIIEASYFDKLFYHNKQLVKQYEEWRDGKKVTKDTGLFYNDIAKPFIDSLTDEIPCTYFDIREHEKALRSGQTGSNRDINALFKILSPYHLLKMPFANDSNELNDKFYKELLHIIGLEEAKEGGKNIIRRKIENRNIGSLIEKVIDELKTEGLHKVPDIKSFGDTTEDQYFNIALELCITWINRILFLKLLEGQLINYHKGDQQYRFLNSGFINDFDELFKLFHKVLAIDVPNRNATIQQKYNRVPYLNSSLFEISDLEDVTIKINAIDSNDILEYVGNSTILKEQKKKNQKLNTLDYLFQFLDAYDFASEGTGDTQEDNKTLINASVLGKVFEKINGYKDGSIYTPGFITMYMSRQSIRLAVLQKFNDAYGWDCKEFSDLDNYIEYQQPEARTKANALINDLKLCDPAVGSGHFLVSALNEIIAIKSELKILQDVNGKRLKEYSIDVVNDELIITDEDNDLFIYNPQSAQSQLIQQTLFSEKQTIIENCLFGVDINPNSVKICRLRLWIELLKNAYYKPDGYLETLPNIDINIKCGNSLISRHKLNDDLSKPLKEINHSISDYRGFVNQYKNCKDRDVKRNLQNLIDKIKNNFKAHIFTKDIDELKKIESAYFTNYERTRLFEVDLTKQQKTKLDKRRIKDLNKIKEKQISIEEIKSNIIYKNAFEWRFEFPEVLNNNGDFEGFDLVIGNPPYFSLSTIEKSLQDYFSRSYSNTFTKGSDIYCLFYEIGINILKPYGFISYITSNRFCFTNYGISLRKYLSEKNILEIINFNDVNVFENANVGSLIMIIENKQIDITSIKTLDFKEQTLLKSIDETIREKSKFLNRKYFNESPWNFDDNEIQSIQLKVQSKGIPFTSWENISINRGITTGLNEVFIISETLYQEIIKIDPISAEILKPILKGANIKRYSILPTKEYIIYTYTDIEIEKYQGVYKYLLQHRESLENVYEARFGMKKWYELRKCNYYEKFFEPKLVWTRLSNQNAFAISLNGEFTVDSSSFAVGEDIKYLSAILNSKVVFFYFKLGSVIWGKDGIKWFGNHFDNIPIPKISIKEQQPFINIVNKILETKQQGRDTIILERQIDALVYQLYDLTPDEIAIVENSGKAEKQIVEITNEDAGI